MCLFDPSLSENSCHFSGRCSSAARCIFLKTVTQPHHLHELFCAHSLALPSSLCLTPSLTIQWTGIIPEPQTDKGIWGRGNVLTIYSWHLWGCTVQAFLAGKRERDSHPRMSSLNSYAHALRNPVYKKQRLEEETSSWDHSDRTVLRQKSWRE